MNENQKRLMEVVKGADTPLVIALAAFLSVIQQRRQGPEAQPEAEADTGREQFTVKDVEQAVKDIQAAHAKAVADGDTDTARDYADTEAYIRAHWMKEGRRHDG